MRNCIFFFIDSKTYSIARSIMFSASVMKLLEIGCQFSWPLGPTTWHHSGNGTLNVHIYTDSLEAVLEELTCPLFRWFLPSFPSVLTGVWLLNMEKRQAPHEQRNCVRKTKTSNGSGKCYLVLYCLFSCSFLWFLLGLSPRCFGCCSFRTAYSLHFS